MTVKRTRHIISALLLACGAFALGQTKTVVGTSAGPAVQFAEAMPERAPGLFNPEALAQSQWELHNWLVSEQPPLSQQALIQVEVSAERLERMARENCEDCGQARRKLAVGVVEPIDKEVDFTNLERMPRLKKPLAQAGGVMRPLDDGGFVWTVAVESKSAAALRIHFTDLDLPEGAALYVYTEAGEAYGPYTGQGPKGDGELWSHTLFGNLAFVQLRQQGPTADDALRRTGFTIESVGHITDKFLMAMGRDRARHGKTCNFNASCVENADCYGSGAWGAIDLARDAIALMQWVSGAFIYTCSGGLIADNDPNSQVPYFLTANHCLSRKKDAGNLQTFFQYATSCNGGACFSPGGAVPTILGSSVVSTSRTADYTLLLLDQAAPAGSAFLGWTAAPVANTNGAQLYRISHPQGAPQSFSTHEVDTSAGTCTSWPRGNWIYSRNVIGATETGSSGSPVCNAAGQIVGQLTGFCGFNLNDVCDNESNAGVDGAFAAYYSEVAQYLDAGGNTGGGTEMHVASITLSEKQQGPRIRGRASITIVDENGDPVSGATVTGTFNGDLNESGSATTDSNGVVEIQSSAQSGVTSWGFCVDNVTGSLSYNAAANVETCDTF